MFHWWINLRLRFRSQYHRDPAEVELIVDRLAALYLAEWDRQARGRDITEVDYCPLG